MRYKYNDVEVQHDKRTSTWEYYQQISKNLSIKKFERKPKMQIYEIQNYDSQKDKKDAFGNFDFYVHIL